MKKILITGSSGYIGSHLCKFLENKYEIHGLDIVDPTIPISKFYKLDINRPLSITDQTEPYHAVIHLAALVNVGQSQQTPIIYYITNINGTMNVLSKIPTNNFIFASTGAAKDCGSVYGVSKKAAEDCVVEYCTKHKIQNYTMFRFYNVLGSLHGINPTNKDGLMHNLIKAAETKEFKIFGNDYNTIDGTCIRDYVHVNEICNAIMLSIETPANGLENLGHGVGYSVKQMVELFKSVNNVDFEIAYVSRRLGDLETSVLENPSKYMTQLYELKDLLKI